MPNLDRPSDLSINFTLDSVSPPLHQVITELVSATQTAALRVNYEVNRSQARVLDLERENAELREQNQRLHEEVVRLRAQLATGPASREGVGALRPDTGELFILERTITKHTAPVHSVTTAPSGDIVATASWDATVKLHSLTSDEVVRTLGGTEAGEAKMGGLYSVAFAATAPEILGCTSCDRSIYLWNHAEGKLLLKLTGHLDEVNGIDFHPSQQVMCTASDDMKVIIWDFKEGIVLRTLDKHTKAVYGASFLGQENQYLVATCCFDGKARVFDMRDKQVFQTLAGHSDDIIGIDYSSKRQCLATGSDDGTISVWDCRTWKLYEKIDTQDTDGLQGNEVKRIAFSQNGQQLAAACSSGRVLVYDISSASARRMAVLGGHTDCVFDVAWGMCPRSGARMLVSAAHDHSSRVWRETV